MSFNPLPSIHKKCSLYPSKLLLLPLATLGIVGFFINTHVSFILSGGLCYPQTNIVFLKTHKTAGSTIQNILMRFGEIHNLNFVLPRTGNYLGHPSLFNRSLVGKPKSFSFNILAHHARLDYEEIKSIMPSNSVYITIIRDPIEIFESSYSYYGFEKLFKSDIHKFIKSLPKFSNRFLSRRFRGKFGANQMFFDLGGDIKVFQNKSQINEYLNKLESWFHLVLVADRMQESLVLLKHLLCWDIDDVVAFKLNARNPIYKSTLDELEKDKLRKLNRADVMLYDRFLRKFETEIEEFGRERMATEVAELDARTQEWYKLCVEGLESNRKYKTKTKHYVNPRVMKFETKDNADNATCRALTMEELPYTELLRQRQIKTHPSSFSHLFPNRVIPKKSVDENTALRTFTKV